ncbi:MAG: hypothetical protein RIR11_1704 [Bacteroidota bacterium]|jgi:hypothetical protein
MATYQNFKNDLLAQLSSSNDADLVAMTEQLLDYTDGLITAYVMGNPPPVIDTRNSSRSMEGFVSADSVEPPPVIDTKNPSKITNNPSNGLS